MLSKSEARERIECRSARTLLAGIDNSRVGAIVTDSGDDVDDMFDIDVDRIGETREFFHQAVRVLRPGGAFVFMGGPQLTSAWSVLARTVGLKWMAELSVLWNTGRPKHRNFESLVTHVSWFHKRGAHHIWNWPQHSIHSNVVVCDVVPQDERHHPNEKPVALTTFLVSLLTVPGDLVVDPFCGSGSTLVSAALCRRPFIGGDINAECVRVARARVVDAEFEDAGSVRLWHNGKETEV